MFKFVQLFRSNVMTTVSQRYGRIDGQTDNLTVAITPSAVDFWPIFWHTSPQIIWNLCNKSRTQNEWQCHRRHCRLSNDIILKTYLFATSYWWRCRPSCFFLCLPNTSSFLCVTCPCSFWTKRHDNLLVNNNKNNNNYSWPRSRPLLSVGPPVLPSLTKLSIASFWPI